MKVIEEFKLSTKRYFFFYEFERMWMLLSIINIIALFIIIRGSTAPIICNNNVLEFLFCTEEDADKTLYNISISYFAAYIFYLMQVYYSERKRTMEALLSIRRPVRNLILWVSRFLFVWDKYKEADKEYIRTAKVTTIYLKDTDGFVYKVDRSRFEDMVTRINKAYDEIITNVAFQNCDYALRRLLLATNIGEYIARLHEQIMEAETLSPSGKIGIGYSLSNIEMMKVKMELLRRLFDIKVNIDFSITTDKKDINDKKKQDKEISQGFQGNKEFCEVLIKNSRKNKTEDINKR